MTLEAVTVISKEIYQARKVAGLCVRCGKEKARDDAYKCAECTAKENAWKRSKKIHDKENGICVSCGKREAVSGKTLCPECAEWNAERAKQRREYWRTVRHCTRCGRNEPFEAKHECEECLMKQQEKTWEWSASQKASYAEGQQQRAAARRQKRAAAGLCTRCGCEKESKDKLLCEKCLKKNRIKGKIRRAEQWIKRPEELCRQCNALAVPGYKLCKTHYDMACAHLEIARSKVNREEHPWHKLAVRLAERKQRLAKQQ